MKGDAASGLACAARWGRSGRGVGAGRVLGAGVAALGRGWAGRGRAGWAGTWAAGWRAGPAGGKGERGGGGPGWAREWAVGKEKGFAGWGGFGVWVFFNLFYFYSKINKV